MTGNIPQSDLEAEYNHAVSIVKDLAKEQDSVTPNSFKERVKKAIRYAADILLMMNIPRHKIAGKLLEDFDGFYSRATVYRILGDEFSEQEEEKNVSNETKDSSSNPQFEQENEGLITVIEKDIDNKKAIINKLRTEPFLSHIPREQIDELLHLYNFSNQNISQEWDGRQDVSERQFHLLVAATKAADDKVTQLYIQYVKEWEPITGKQYTKLMHGRATLFPALFDPKNKREATEMGFYGMQCKCGSWRVAPTPEVGNAFIVRCYACKSEFVPKTEELPINKGIVLDESMSTHQFKQY